MVNKYKIFIRISSIILFLFYLIGFLKVFDSTEILATRISGFIFGTLGSFLSINLFKLREFARKWMIGLMSIILVLLIIIPIQIMMLSSQFHKDSSEYQSSMFTCSIVGSLAMGFLLFYTAFLYSFTRKSIKEQFK